MSWVEFFGVSNLVMGFLTTLFGLASAFIVWVHRRMKSVATDVSNKASGSHAETAHRVGHLETKVVALTEDVGRVQRDLTSISGRVTNVERTMERLATKSDVSELSRDFAGLKAAFETQVNTITSQITMLFQQALKARPKD